MVSRTAEWRYLLSADERIYDAAEPIAGGESPQGQARQLESVEAGQPFRRR
jgi:hypothetical protein